MHSRKCSAFSLVELLVVITIIGIIGSFAVPAVKSMLKGSALNNGANMLMDEIALARQHALTKSRIVEFRFYRFADPEVPGETVATPSTGHFRAFQFFELADSGAILPVGKFKRIPDTIILNSGLGDANAYALTTLSSLLGEAVNFNTGYVLSSLLKAADPELPRGVKKKYDYVFFRFMPDGTTSLSATGRDASASEGGKWFITLHSLADLTKVKTDSPAPPNFITWMIDPVAGTSKLLRPGLK